MGQKTRKKTILIFFLVAILLPLRSQLLINEFQASNITTGVDLNVNYRQWLEIYNGGNQTVDLYGYCLSDQAGDPVKYRISEHINVASKKVVILWLEPGNEDYGELKLDMDGGELSLANSSGTVIDHIAYPAQYIDISFGRVATGSSD